MDERCICRYAALLCAERIKRVKRTKLPSIGEEGGLYYALKHRDRARFAVFSAYGEDVRELLVSFEADFFSIEVKGAARLADGSLLLCRICGFAVEHSLDYGELMKLIEMTDMFNMSELLALPAFVRRACLKELAHCAVLLRYCDEQSADALNERIAELIAAAHELADDRDYIPASSAHGILMKARGFDIFDEESVRRCVCAFAELSARSGQGDKYCAEKLNELCDAATADVFLLGGRRTIFARSIGIKRFAPPPLAILRTLLIVIPAAAGSLISMIFDNDFAKPIYALMLSVCAANALLAYFADRTALKRGDRAPCAARTEGAKEARFVIPEGCFITREGKSRLSGIKALYGCRDVRTRPVPYGRGSALAELTESGGDDALFYSLLGINTGECGLFSQSGEGDIFDSRATLIYPPKESIGELLQAEADALKRELAHEARTSGEALMKLSGILRGVYPLCALALMMLSGFHTLVEALLMQLCAAGPPFLAGWTGFWRRLEEVLAQKGSNVRMADIRSVVRSSLLSAGVQVALFPVRTKQFIYAAAGVDMTYKTGKGLVNCIGSLFPCILFALIELAFCLAVRGTLTFLPLFWAFVYFTAPIALRFAEKV